MKRIIFKISVFLSCLILSVFAMPKISAFSVAEEITNPPEKHSLISSDFVNQENILEKYNINNDNVSSFTPFDLNLGVRMQGNSFKFSTGERNQIENQFVRVNETNVESGEYSLFMWIYFDAIYLHDLTVTLQLENGSTIKWEFLSEDLVALVKKTSTVSILSLPYSWNQIEFPFNLATKTGEIFESNKLSTIKKIFVDFTSEPIINEEGENVEENEKLDISYSGLYFYDVYLSNSTKNDEYSVEKQNYRFIKANFYSTEFINSLCVGDEITLPTFINAISYAWNGQVDLKNSKVNTIVWKVVVKTPGEKNNFLYPSFGDKITLDKEGVYQIFYQCKDLNVSNDVPVFSESIEINVNKLRGVYFDKKTYNLEIGKTYILNAHTSSLFSSITWLKFDSDSTKLIIEDLGGGRISVTVTGEGTFNIKASVKGKRIVSNIEKEYSENITIKGVNKENDDKTTKILLYIGLGIGVFVFVIMIIKKIVENRKYGIK